MSETATNPKVIPTIEEIKLGGENTRSLLRELRLSLVATIPDYPIGRSLRAMCEISVERKKNQGYRTVKRTQNKHGQWCKPKASTYSDSVMVVASGLLDEGYDYDCAWICSGYNAVSVSFAAGQSHVIMKAPCWSKPRREPETITWKIQTLDLSLNGLGGRGPVETKTDTLEADPPELCDAYDAWIAELAAIQQILLDVWA